MIRATATTLELVFDLVFVFALTQITEFMAKDPDALRITQGLLILGLFWWSWVGYSWLGNLVKADDSPGGWSAPYAIATGYFVLRAVHLCAMWVVSAADPGFRRQVARFAASMITATALLLAAAAASGSTRTWLWVAALAADYAGTLAGGASGWRLPSAKHFSCCSRSG